NSNVSTTDTTIETRIIAAQPGPPPTGLTSVFPNLMDTTYPTACRMCHPNEPEPNRVCVGAPPPPSDPAAAALAHVPSGPCRTGPRRWLGGHGPRCRRSPLR